MLQYLTLDSAIVVGYLLITLAIGIRYGRNITTMRQYVIGDRRRYSMFVVVATLFATVAGGGATVGRAEKIFTFGVVWAIIPLGFTISLLLTARYIAPHIGRFHAKLSVGEMMGDFYGKSGRVTTGMAGTLVGIGQVAAQIAAIGYLFHHLLGLPHAWGVGIACGIVVLYATFGGIRSVTATDIIQFGVLLIGLVLLAVHAVDYAGGYPAIYANVPKGHLNPLAQANWTHAFVFLSFLIPFLDPAFIQRFLMTRDAEQAYDMFRFSGWLWAAITLLIALIALAMAASGDQIEPHLTLPHAIGILGPGVKGIGVAALFAVLMSSADSYLHATAVSLVHDVVQPLRKAPLPDDKELKWTRVATLLLGCGAMIVAVSFHSIFDLLITFWAFWMPVVSFPLMAGITAHRSSVRSFVIGAISGFVVVIVWKAGFGQHAPFGPIIPGLLANLFAFSFARTFDKPEELHFGKDERKDPRWRKYVELYRQRREAKFHPKPFSGNCDIL